MKTHLFLWLSILPFLLFGQASTEIMKSNIQNNDLLMFGGCDLIEVEGQSYIAGVSAVDVGTKKMSSLVRVGKIKAEREIVTFINGSNITSSTESYIKEELITINDSSSIKTVDLFVESIREDADGFVKAMKSAGYWYSDDKSVFYYAIYKKVNLK